MESPHFTQLAATLTVFGVSGWIRTTALLRGDLQSPAFDRSATLTFGGFVFLTSTDFQTRHHRVFRAPGQP